MPEHTHPSVDIGSIERELTLLWKENEDSATPVVRACSLNLILTGGDDSGTGALLDDLSVQHPARTFLVSFDDQSPLPIEAWVAARCSIPLPGEKQVCCEQIHLRCNSGPAGRITSVVTSLLVPDVPTVLWHHPESKIPDTLFREFHRLCDFTILDSAGEQDLKRGLRLSMDEGQKPLADLAWERTEIWRQLFVSVFDSHDARIELEELEGLQLKYANKSGLPSAMLFGAWVCQSLRLDGSKVLTRQGHGGFEGEVRRNHRTIHFAIEPGQPQNSGGPIHSVVLDFPKSSYRMSVNDAESCFGFTRRRHTGEQEGKQVPFRALADIELVSRLLVNLDSDESYRKGLSTLMKMVELQT